MVSVDVKHHVNVLNIFLSRVEAELRYCRRTDVTMTYFLREFCQKQHHRRRWRKRHSFDLHSAKNGVGIRVFATSAEAKREGRIP